ncbi:MAG: ATP-binding cassette domain-containing protein [Candidatus Lokiarchaeota archaeon]|nr:ATP-binding cassette domain-containing protein [Candidatus Lokiarchaeota archaeon]MBD3199265.1 ATP-binding cassette domain-containing protein [Candidatus Lokiarchaeota archaeon]
MKSNIIKVNNLSKHFDEIKAVDGIDFSVDQGEIFGFLGPNGAGKTTTIRMMTGVLKPTSGTIQIYGKNVWKNQIIIKQILGNVPEMANVYMDLTGLQNLNFIGEVYGVPKKIREKRALKLLKKFELFGRKDSLAKKYSKGMKQRLLLCMALMSNPRILFLDEPTSGLDVQSSIIIKNLIKEYNNDGMTIFLTTHNMNVANEMCDRIAIINKGKIIKMDTPENLRAIEHEYQSIDLYLSQDIDESSLERVEGVEEVKKIKNYYHIVVRDLDTAIFQIIDYIKANDIKIKKINTPEPSLEEVFISAINGGENY